MKDKREEHIEDLFKRLSYKSKDFIKMHCAKKVIIKDLQEGYLKKTRYLTYHDVIAFLDTPKGWVRFMDHEGNLYCVPMERVCEIIFSKKMSRYVIQTELLEYQELLYRALPMIEYYSQ